MQKNTFKVMLVVGEASGDAHAAELVNALRAKGNGTFFEFFGSTGAKMREAQVETIVNADELSIMGILEVGNALPMFLRVFRKLKRIAIKRKPNVVILVDFPEFNLKLARALKREGFAVIYYVSPQLWAWRSYRVELIRKYVDLVLTILPFEKEWYSDRGVQHVEYVGHPLVGEVKPKLTREEFCVKHKLDPSRKIVTLLPGSRRREISRILPPMLEAVAILLEQRPGLQFCITIAPTRTRNELDAMISKSKIPREKIILVENETRSAVASAEVAVVASGTATLETALLQTPLAVVYKVSAHNWHTLRHLINVPHYGLVNLVAGERLATELIQNDCNGRKIAEEILRLLHPVVNADFRTRLSEVTRKLGDGGASNRASEIVWNFLQKEITQG